MRARRTLKGVGLWGRCVGGMARFSRVSLAIALVVFWSPACGDSGDSDDWGDGVCWAGDCGPGPWDDCWPFCDYSTPNDNTPNNNSAICGNGVVEAGEQCDGPDMGLLTCSGLGYSGGILSCNANCIINRAFCWKCGNRRLDDGEECDDGNTTSGDGCSSDCLSDETCGNGITDTGIGEECDDGNNVDGDGCNADCVVEYCGDDILNAAEDCDGSDLDGQDCQSQGFLTGTLSCLSDCTFDTISCAYNICGNGTVETGEECDDGNTDDGDGCSSDCLVE